MDEVACAGLGNVVDFYLQCLTSWPAELRLWCSGAHIYHVIANVGDRRVDLEGRGSRPVKWCKSASSC